MTISYTHQTDVGVKRDHNEDNYIHDSELGLFIVCDGMGGHAAGEVASQMTCDIIHKEIKNHKDLLEKFNKNQSKEFKDQITQLISSSIEKANTQVNEMGRMDLSKSGMGTTVVLLLILQGHAFIAHVGDSRLYLHRNNVITQFTQDHSFVNEMLTAGIITPEQAINHPRANVITRAIGIASVIEPDTVCIETLKDDKFLLCSDGLYEYFSEDELQKSLSTYTDETIDKLIKQANERGGKDNITVLIINNNHETHKNEAESSIDKKIKILSKIPIFYTLDPLELSKILEIIDVVQFPKATTFITQGEDGTSMYIILKGAVDVLVNDAVVSHLKAGEYIGEMSLVDKAPRSATIITQEDTKLMKIERDDLLSLLKRNPRLGLKLLWSLIKNMNVRLRKSNGQ